MILCCLPWHFVLLSAHIIFLLRLPRTVEELIALCKHSEVHYLGNPVSSGARTGWGDAISAARLSLAQGKHSPLGQAGSIRGAVIDHQHSVAEIWICISAFYHHDLQKAVPYLQTLPLLSDIIRDYFCLSATKAQHIAGLWHTSCLILMVYPSLFQVVNRSCSTRAYGM